MVEFTLTRRQIFENINEQRDKRTVGYILQHYTGSHYTFSAFLDLLALVLDWVRTERQHPKGALSRHPPRATPYRLVKIKLLSSIPTGQSKPQFGCFPSRITCMVMVMGPDLPAPSLPPARPWHCRGSMRWLAIAVPPQVAGSETGHTNTKYRVEYLTVGVNYPAVNGPQILYPYAGTSFTMRDGRCEGGHSID